MHDVETVRILAAQLGLILTAEPTVLERCCECCAAFYLVSRQTYDARTRKQRPQWCRSCLDHGITGH